MRKFKAFILRIIAKIGAFINKYQRAIKIILISILALMILSKIYEEVFGYHFKARFKELGPLSSHMPVYFRGYKVGKTMKVSPADNYQYTIVKIRVFPRDLKIPVNTIAKAQKFDSGKDYIELVYPDSPAIEMVEQGSEIEGKTTVDIKKFMSSQIDSGILGEITNNASTTLASVEKTSNEIKGLVADFREILQENRPNIKLTTDNIVKVSENLGYMSLDLSILASHVKDAVDKKQIESAVNNLNQSTKNVELATRNLEGMTHNLDHATKDIDKTVAKVDATVGQANEMACHLKNITKGFRELLCKKFAGLRLFFGTPMDNCPCRTCKK